MTTDEHKGMFDPCHRSRSASQSLDNADIREVHERDGGKCGIHIGGCGLDVSVDQATRDELIPQSYFESEEVRKFENDWFAEWNTQVTHPKCRGIMRGLPVELWFRCACHMAYIDVDKETLRVLYRGPDRMWQDNAVAADVIDSYSIFANVQKRFLVKLQGSRAVLAYLAQADDRPRSEALGSWHPRYTEYVAHKFNMIEMTRRHPFWPSMVQLTVREAMQAEEFKMTGDGYFRFSHTIDDDTNAPVLTFALPIAEATLLDERSLWLTIDSWDKQSGLSYRWDTVREILDEVDEDDIDDLSEE